MACSSCKKRENRVFVTPTNSQFKFRDNTDLYPIEFGSGLMISNTNMSDELAFMFLKENPNRISLFEKYPENWKELNVETASDKTVIKGHGKNKSK